MKCHHCHTPIIYVRERVGVIHTNGAYLLIESSVCPKCGNANIYMSEGKPGPNGVVADREIPEILLYPRFSLEKPAPELASEEIRTDYSQAAMIRMISPDASAALSRRCFRRIARTMAAIPPDLFSREMEAVAGLPGLPSGLKEEITGLLSRHEYAAYPVFEKNPSIITRVNREEADTWISVLESLLHHFYEDH